MPHFDRENVVVILLGLLTGGLLGEECLDNLFERECGGKE